MSISTTSKGGGDHRGHRGLELLEVGVAAQPIADLEVRLLGGDAVPFALCCGFALGLHPLHPSRDFLTHPVGPLIRSTASRVGRAKSSSADAS